MSDKETITQRIAGDLYTRVLFWGPFGWRERVLRPIRHLLLKFA